MQTPPRPPTSQPVLMLILVTGEISLFRRHSIQTSYEDKDRDNQIYLSISLPFGNGGRVGYDMQNGRRSTTHRMSWNDTLDERNSWGMSAGLQSDRPDNGAQVSGNYQRLVQRVSGIFLVPMPPMITVPSAAAGAVLSPQPNMVQRFIAAAPPMNHA